MKHADMIYRFNNYLLVRFGATGEKKALNLIPLNHALSLSCTGQQVMCASAGEHQVLDTFASEALAATAFDNLQAVLEKYARRERWLGWGRRTMLWGVAPLGMLMLAMALNVGVSRSATLTQAPYMSDSSSPTGTTSASATPSQPAAPPAGELAKALQDGVKAGRYTVQLSAGKKGTVYVFSDPLCPHCKDLEPELAKLGQQYTIHVFPVSVIGGDTSADGVNKVLCESAADSRANRWRKLTDGNPQALEGSKSCQEGQAGLEANNKFFRVLHFQGTPTIINAKGELYPDNLPNQADAIANWLQTSGA
ncbi:hypothetical protein CEK28_00025 [Xenophilus sp. AP218F]|nr:hypothetical protein CEK28_00025 [Xenophilus sp. AP218F]